jgi:predicted transcriptional regulator
MKITQEQIEQIRKLNSEGKNQREIAKELGIWQSRVSYWISEDVRKNRSISAMKRFNRLTEQQKKACYLSRRDYNKKYMSRRYREDEKFRNTIKERSKIWKRKNYKKVEK